MEYTIKFPNADHLTIILQALGQIPYKQAKPVVDNIVEQVKTIEAKAREDAKTSEEAKEKITEEAFEESEKRTGD